MADCVGPHGCMLQQVDAASITTRSLPMANAPSKSVMAIYLSGTALCIFLLAWAGWSRRDGRAQGLARLVMEGR